MPSFYEVDLFRKESFIRKKCPNCGRFYWTLDEEKSNCSEPPCTEYSFINNPPTKDKLDLHKMRETFLSFFESEGHTRIARYPVISRWRDDTFFTIASIACFQPWVLNRTIDPPANPLVMSQTCLRFNDIDNVGKSGRHLTLFEMMAHHVFNTKENYIYFNDRTVELCHEFLKTLGVDETEMSYIEENWQGGGNSGPCIEVIVRGNEVATLVFMMYDDLPNGKKKLMDMQVVDTGYGLERFTWLSQGTPNVYEAIFSNVLGKLKKEADIETDLNILTEYAKLAGMVNVESNLELKELREKAARRIGMKRDDLEKYVIPLENLYSICDHTKALTFILNDGMIPSNVKGGYFARMLARRALRSLKFLKLNISLRDILSWQIDDLKKSFPELEKNRDDTLKIIEVEEKKYEKTVLKGGRIISEIDSKLKREGRKELSIDDLIKLYDSHGLTPELVKDFSELIVDIPDDFYIQVAKSHEADKVNKGKIIEKIKIPENIPETQLGFYEDPMVKEFKGKVVSKFNDWLVLDKTYFYGEGGGQEGDKGTINGCPVLDTQKAAGGVILHKMRKEDLEKFKPAMEVSGSVDWKRRFQLMQHHTGTHIINGAARRVLGNHIFQSGANKSEKLGRLDITHYEGISDEKLKEIEDIANKVVSEGREIYINFMQRDVAEKKFGFRIYQGGAVPGKIIRIVNIKGWDVEACGGTHFLNTKFVGRIKILRAKRIQDGILRLEYKIGGAYDAYEKEITSIREKFRGDRDGKELSEKDLSEIAAVFSVSINQVPKTIERFKKEWIKQANEIRTLEDRLNEISSEKCDYCKDYEVVPTIKSVETSKKLFVGWKKQKKIISKLRREFINCISESLKKNIESFKEGEEGLVKKVLPGFDVRSLKEIAGKITSERGKGNKSVVVILAGILENKATIVVASSNPLKNAGEIAKSISKKLGGGGHGNEKLGVGGGNAGGIENIITEFKI